MNEPPLKPTPAERQYGEIQERAKANMMRAIYAAVEEATQQACKGIEAAGIDLSPPPYGYFAATVHQQMFCTLCGADPETFIGGRADVAEAVIRNGQNIARHYWGADTEKAERTM